jgi:SCO1/SenC
MKPEPSVWRPRVMLILLAAVFLAPVVTSWWLHAGLKWRPADTINHGVLIVPPRRLDTTYRLLTPGGTPLRPDYLRGKWSLVTVGGSSCDTVCAGNFYKMRQVYLAQGENMRRVQRLFVFVSTQAAPPDAVQEYPEMDVALLSPSAQATFLAPFLIDGVEPLKAGRVYLIDPLGNLMMYYAPDAAPTGMRKDLARLLKVSSVG